MFRYNLRKMTDANRFSYSLSNIEGRLKYNDLINAKGAEYYHYEKNMPVQGKQGKKRPVYQVKDGEVIAQFPTIVAASKAAKISEKNIRRVLKGENNTAGGFHWVYA